MASSRRGGDDQRADGPAGDLAAGEALQDGRGEGTGFARAGLCQAQDIPALKHGRNGARLNGRGRSISLTVQGV